MLRNGAFLEFIFEGAERSRLFVHYDQIYDEQSSEGDAVGESNYIAERGLKVAKVDGQAQHDSRRQKNKGVKGKGSECIFPSPQE